MENLQAILLAAGEGKQLWVLGDLYTFKLTGKDTGGSFTLIESVIQPHAGPPPHIHYREDETFYVLEGSFSFLSGEVSIEATAGHTVYIPKGTLHTFKNTSGKQARLLTLISPSGLEDFFEEIGQSVIDKDNPPPVDPAVIDKIMALAPQYHLEVKLPEPSV